MKKKISLYMYRNREFPFFMFFFGEDTIGCVTWNEDYLDQNDVFCLTGNPSLYQNQINFSMMTDLEEQTPTHTRTRNLSKTRSPPELKRLSVPSL